MTEQPWNGRVALTLLADKEEDRFTEFLAQFLTWDDAASLVDPGQRSRISKFQPCLPLEIEYGLIAREKVDDANATLVEWRGGPQRGAET